MRPRPHQDRHTSSSVTPALSRPCSGPSVQVGPQGLEGWPAHFPPRAPNAAGAAAAAAAAAAPPPGRDFQPVTPIYIYIYIYTYYTYIYNSAVRDAAISCEGDELLLLLHN